MTIEHAKIEFIADLEARGLEEVTVKKYWLLFRRLEAFAKRAGFRYFSEFNTPALRRFRSAWGLGARTGNRTMERLRGVFKFACENGWIADNPARTIKNAKEPNYPTMPFAHDEFDHLLGVATEKIATVHSSGRDNARRLRVLLLFLRYTGLRISDAVKCSTDRLADGKVRLYTQKTGVHGKIVTFKTKPVTRRLRRKS